MPYTNDAQRAEERTRELRQAIRRYMAGANGIGELVYACSFAALEYQSMLAKYNDLRFADYNAIHGALGVAQKDYWEFEVLPYEREKRRVNGEINTRGQTARDEPQPLER